jgi:L-asparaginase
VGTCSKRSSGSADTSAKVPIVACGGSIESQVRLDGVKEVVGDIGPLAAAAASLAAVEVRVERFARRASFSFDLGDLVRLASAAAAAAAGGARPVVTFGTDLMEEAAFVLDLLAPEPGVVVTGGSGDASTDSDGVENLAAALRCSRSPELAGGCCYVAFARCVRLGRDLVETEADGDQFAGSTGPPVASWSPTLLEPAARRADRRPLPRPPVPAAPARTLIVQANVAAPTEQRIEDDVDVVVVAAFGAGNVPPALGEALEERLARGLPVVLCAASHRIPVRRVSVDPGGGARLLDRGALAAGVLTPRKAAVLGALCFGDGNAAGAARFAEVVAGIAERHGE